MPQTGRGRGKTAASMVRGSVPPRPSLRREATSPRDRRWSARGQFVRSPIHVRVYAPPGCVNASLSCASATVCSSLLPITGVNGLASRRGKLRREYVVHQHDASGNRANYTWSWWGSFLTIAQASSIGDSTKTPASAWLRPSRSLASLASMSACQNEQGTALSVRPISKFRAIRV